MTTPQTIARDPATGDLAIVNGSIQLTSTLAEYVVAAIQERLSMFAGEWYLDTREGVPYFRIVSERPDVRLLRSLFRRAVLAVPGVDDVTLLEVEFQSRTRDLLVTIDVTLTDGEVLTDVPFIVPWTPTGATA